MAPRAPALSPRLQAKRHKRHKPQAKKCAHALLAFNNCLLTAERNARAERPGGTAGNASVVCGDHREDGQHRWSEPQEIEQEQKRERQKSAGWRRCTLALVVLVLLLLLLLLLVTRGFAVFLLRRLCSFPLLLVAPTLLRLLPHPLCSGGWNRQACPAFSVASHSRDHGRDTRRSPRRQLPALERMPQAQTLKLRHRWKLRRTGRPAIASSGRSHHHRKLG
eukprot:scaffold10675_cov121-Isochrysis_galbana.AAC.3